MKKISVIGLGKLGMPFAITVASRGFPVIGIDIDKNAVKALNSGKFNSFEPMIGKLWENNKSRFQSTTNYKLAVSESDITFIVVPTPSLKNGAFSNAIVTQMLKKIGSYLKSKKTFHLISLISTVIPTSSENIFISVLEKKSGKKCGVDFGLCYNPSFIALGNVVKNLLEPYFILIGESDNKSGNILEKFYKKFVTNKSPIIRSNLINAEIAKISLNSYITMKISFANMIAHLCEKLPGANASDVTKIIGNDKRIGALYLKGAVSYGGPCFPRDNKALQYAGKKVKVLMPLSRANDQINRRHTTFLIRKIRRLVKQDSRITVLGLSYKENTDVVDESQGIILAQKLKDQGYSVVVYDPRAVENAKRVLESKVQYAHTLLESLKQSDIMIITVKWPEFLEISDKEIKVMNKNPMILDLWGFLNPKKFTAVKYYTVGTLNEKN